MQLFERMLLQQVQTVTEAANVAFTRLIVNEAWDELRPQLDMEVKQHPKLNPTLSDVDMRVRRFAKGTDLIKVKIYNMQGITVYSSDPNQLGEDKSKNSGFLEAVRGRVASETNYRGKFGAFDGELYDRNLVSSYVPVRGFQGVEAVVEVYADRTPSIDGVKVAIGKAWLYFGSGVATAFLLVLTLCRISSTQRTEPDTHGLSQDTHASTHSQASSNPDLIAEGVVRLESQRSDVSALVPSSSDAVPDAKHMQALIGSVRPLLESIEELALIYGVRHRQQAPNPQVTPIAEPLSLMLQDYTQRWADKGIQLQAHLAQDLEQHKAADASSVVRVLELLLEDAARRTVQGHIRFSALLLSGQTLQVEIIGNRDEGIAKTAESQQPNSLSLQAARSLSENLRMDISKCSFGERGPWYTVTVPVHS